MLLKDTSKNPKNPYLLVQNIDTFSNYPDVGIDWNGFLLHSIAYYFIDELIAIEMPINNIKTLAIIFILSNLQIDDYKSFLYWKLKISTAKSASRSFTEMKQFLLDEKLIHLGLPKSLYELIIVDKYNNIVFE